MYADQLATNAARAVIIPLDDVANALGLKEGDFAPVVWNAGIYNNQRYGIPLDMHPFGLYYNKTLMEKAGLDPNKPPQTSEEYVAALQEFKKSGIQGSWVSPFLFTGTFQWQSMLWQFGGDLYNEDVTKATFNSDAGVEALTWMVDLVKNGHSPKNVAQDAENVAFQNDKNALLWNGIWMINIYKQVKGLEWGVAPVPQIGPEKGVWANSHNIVIMNKQPLDDNKVQASKVFINWISQRSIEWAKAGQVPARRSVRESQEFNALEEQAQLAQQVPYMHFVPPVPGIADVQTTTFELAVNEAVLLKKEPKAALDEAASRADQLLEENRQKYQA
jgi:multiple sugar transport system substrate-binding protein